jgi:hypothetical protein
VVLASEAGVRSCQVVKLTDQQSELVFGRQRKSIVKNDGSGTEC